MLRTASSIPLPQGCYTGLRPAVCRPDRQPATGPPGSFPDRTSPAIDDKLRQQDLLLRHSLTSRSAGHPKHRG